MAAALVGAALLLLPAAAVAQGTGAAEAAAPSLRPAGQPVYDTALYGALDYRMIGPSRGGRAQSVAGIAEKPLTFYMGATGGGVWKTADAGESWEPVTDGFLAAGSIGAIDVADSDPSVVYVGTGEADIRGNASAGRGLYRSVDAGKTWSFIGLEEAGQIGDIVVHPRDPERVYVAALGHAFGPNSTRGVFRSRDGGRSWEKVLFVSDSTGFVDLAMNPENPREIYAAAWRAERKPWTLYDGAAEGGLWKTADGGATWEKLGGGLPTGVVGKIGVTVSPANPGRVWALVQEEASDRGGVYRSDDAGKSWSRVNRDRKLRQRAFYYTHVYADPQDPETVYALNTGLYRSVDGGRTFDRIPVPHGDTHDLWINPLKPEIMALADDGGAQVTTNGGESWSTMHNQPTAQFYRVFVDDGFPYRVFGGQQDNSAMGVSAWLQPAPTRFTWWHETGGCESGYVAVDPRDPEIVYGGCYSGDLYRFDARTRQARNVVPYPQMQDGQPIRSLKYRFNWNPPFLISRHEPGVLYYGAQYVLRSDDEGQSWAEISPDLTRADPGTQGYPGGPVQHDITGVETYATVFALAESPHESGVLWAGSDDGLVHVTRDGGETWADVTPQGLPRLSTVNTIEPSPHRPGKAYVTAYRYRFDDFRPYVFRTEDYGQTWTRIADGTRGIPADYATRVVREDPEREGLLYAGTEFGTFVSFDDGAHWQTLQLDLPVVPITDLAVKGTDLVVATQGRSFWVLDDVTPLRQLTDGLARAATGDPGRVFFQPRDAYRTPVSGYRGDPAAPEPPPEGAVFHYYLDGAADAPVTLRILGPDGDTIRTFRSASPGDGAGDDRAGRGRGGPGGDLPAEAGMHRVTWDLRHEAPDLVEDAVVFYGFAGGPPVAPDTYRARLSSGDWSETRAFRVRMDPRLEEVPREDLLTQEELLVRIRDRIQEIHDALRRLRSVREQARDVSRRVEEDDVELAGGISADTVAAAVAALADSLTAVEETLLQTKAESGQDPINFRTMLSGRYAHLAGVAVSADARPTDGSMERMRDLEARWSEESSRLDRILDGVDDLNALLRRGDVRPVMVPRGSGAP